MSIDSNVRSRVWKFTHTLHTPLEQHATRVSAATNVEPYDVLKQLFQSLILSTRLPSNAKVIQLRVTPEKPLMCLSPMQEQNNPLSDLPFDGYIQSSQNKLDRDSLKSWIDATWEQVDGKLNAHPAFLNGFLKPDDATAAAYVYYFQMLGEPAVSTGGRPPKLPPVSLKYSLRPSHCMCHIRHM
jgi:hypothetical protein